MTYCGGTGVEHLPDAFAHLEEQLTRALHLVRVLVQVGEHVIQQSVEIWNLSTNKNIIIHGYLKRKKATQYLWRAKGPTFLIKKEKLSAAKLRMCSFLCASSVL